MLTLNLGEHGGSVTIDNVGTVYRYGDGVIGLATDQWRIFIAADGSDVMVRPAGDAVPMAETATDALGHGFATVKAAPRDLSNQTAQEGCSRCECGCKYWEGNCCIGCGTTHDPERHDNW
jgi:hypothetical protein